MSAPKSQQIIRVVDSHTAGEPTRVVIEGGPDLPSALPIADRIARLEAEHETFRTAVVYEPRGSEALVGALIGPPSESDALLSVIFFNNVGYLRMCIHGTIGLVTTLAHLGRVTTGVHTLETPVGKVTAELCDDGEVAVTNIASYRHLVDVGLHVPGYGNVTGDVAYSGNWFFQVNHHDHDLSVQNADDLVEYTWAIRMALERAGIRGAHDGLIDHIALYQDQADDDSDSHNFVLCPGKAYDRSPCGTGTGAKLASLYAQGRLKPGQIWRQKGLLGGVFRGSVAIENDQVLPTVRGRAFITAEANLVLQQDDPFRAGVPK